MFGRRKTSVTPRRPRASGKTKAPLTYYRAGGASTDTSPFQKKPADSKKVSKLFIRTIDLLVVIALVVGLTHSLILKPPPVISLSNNSYRKPSVYQNAAADKLRSYINRNKITVNDSAVSDHLLSKFPEIVSVLMQIPIIGQSPRLSLIVSEPSFFLESGRGRYVVNRQGKVVGKSTDFPHIKRLPVVIDNSGFEVQEGRQILSAKATIFMNVLIGHLDKANIEIKSLTLPALPYELHLRTSDINYLTKFYLNGEATQQVGQYLAAKEHFKQSGNTPTEYLDVRVPGKIFSK